MAGDDQRPERFIDLAENGGCSQKCDATRLRALLDTVAPPLYGGTGPDAGLAVVGGRTLASSVDVVLPMVDDPELFGRIVTAHVLSDLYAVGALPLFALNVLGLPRAAASDDRIAAMLAASGETLEREGAICLGGHTLAFEALFFGIAATGEVPDGRAIGIDGAMAGDRLVLTKPLGTSLATKTWKTEDVPVEDFSDVVEGMLRSNREASRAMTALGRCACTDVSGFGFLGHLHNLLAASGVAAALCVQDVPVYASVRAGANGDPGTRILAANRSFVEPFISNPGDLNEATWRLLSDAEISGGLVVAVAASEVDAYLADVEGAGGPAWVVGEVVEGEPGQMTLA